MIRVSADLIEKMIDLSGENSINRSRIEMDLSQFSHTLVEMELAIQRLADQLRRMEGELETQIIAKHGIEHSRYTDFDPLEMDQYSSLNQLSKSLAESASDLVDFKIRYLTKSEIPKVCFTTITNSSGNSRRFNADTFGPIFAFIAAFTTNCSSDVYSIE